MNKLVVEALHNGSHEAYDIVYMTYYAALKEFLSRLIGSAEDGKELTQMTFITLWEKREQIDPEKSIKGYIFTIAKNTALKYLRERKKFPGDSTDTGSLQLSNNFTPADNIIAEDTRLLIELSVNNMPKQRQEVYKLIADGHSYEEVAAILSITPENARKHFSLARKNLNDVLKAFFLFLTLS